MIGQREKKSLCSGVMYVEQPVSRRKGDVLREISQEQGLVGMGDIVMAETSTSLQFSLQSRKHTRSSRVSTLEKLAYSSMSAAVIMWAIMSTNSSVISTTWASQSVVHSIEITVLEVSSRMYVWFSLSW